MRYELILLDADNTLFDYDKAEEHALFETLKHFKVPGDYKVIRSKYREINSNLWKMLERKEITKDLLKTQRFNKLFIHYGLELSDVEFSNYYLLKLGEGSFLLDGAEELCKYLHSKYRLIILTNGIQTVQDSRIKGSSIYKYIDDIITSDEVGINKPDARIFRWTFDKIGHVNKKNTIIIGDSLGSDILGGINFGIDTCWFNFNKLEDDAEIIPTYKIDSLKELYNII